MKQGFSLLEFSIVLVIAGLLVGGILVGRSLIHAAELHSIVADYEKYVSAVSTFKTKYNNLPGDMPDATRFWGTMGAAACPGATSPDTGNPATRTCNGDGDGIVRKSDAVNQAGEIYLFWQHLANAELIEGDYTGIVGPGSRHDSIVSENVPESIRGAGWTVFWFAPTDSFTFGTDITYYLNYKNSWQLGADHPTRQTFMPFLTAAEAQSIDEKTDDGKPAMGKTVVRYWDGGCAEADDGSNANNDYNASYRVEDETIQCSLIFRHAF